MIKQAAVSSGVDLKEFFEASVSALQNESKPIASLNRNRALVLHRLPDETQKKRAVADAAKALAALWKMQTSTHPA
jgi:hypothetical protein